MVNRGLGFSMWLDFIERDFVATQFPALIEKGVINGATSNPAIFGASIQNSPAYHEQIAALANHDAKSKYEAIAKYDIAMAAKALKPLYDRHEDGFVSIEVDPFLCDDTGATVEEGKRLHEEIGFENVMIKVPATDAGYGAMESLVAQGIPVNATLIFSPMQAEACIAAITEGLARYRSGSGTKNVQTVLSVFVSRFDRMLDKRLEAGGLEPGRLGCMNAAKIYSLCEAGNEPAIRTLFASTGVKGDAYPADYYIKALMATHSVNTAPLATIEAYLEGPTDHAVLPLPKDEIAAFFIAVEKAGIDMEDVYQKLTEEGIQAFKEAFAGLLAHLE